MATTPLRTELTAALRDAMRAKDERAVATVRLILAALKDRDIAARPKGVVDGIADEEILGLLQAMIKQRRESIVLYEQGRRPDLVRQESEEIAVIERFLPAQMSDQEQQAAVKAVIAELGASSLKDMGRIMASLRERFAGRMDFAKASATAKQALS